MHQKNNPAPDPSSTTVHPFGDEDDDDETDGKNPFADDGDDFDEDEDDDALRGSGQGSWWRGVVRRRGNVEDKDSDEDDAHDDDEEFGDFALPGDEKEKDADPENVVLKPLAVNPAKEGTRGLSGLWPFSTKADKDKATDKDDTNATSPVDAANEKRDAEQSSGVVEVTEAKRRTSIEDPDEEVVV